MKCYFKNLAESQSKEGVNYQSRFPNVDFQRCLYRCPNGHSVCKEFIEDSQEGLVKVLETIK
jgi:hypothetical protein